MFCHGPYLHIAHLSLDLYLMVCPIVFLGLPLILLQLFDYP
jgi:hypothetical protein